MKRNHIVDSIIDSGLIEPKSAVVIGLSGGPDSLCLLHALSSISDMLDLALVPVHINHMLRPEAESEADHAADMCDRLDLECKIFEAPCSEIAQEMGISTEEASIPFTFSPTKRAGITNTRHASATRMRLLPGRFIRYR